MEDEISPGCKNTPFSGSGHMICAQNPHVHPSLRQLHMKCWQAHELMASLMRSLHHGLRSATSTCSGLTPLPLPEPLEAAGSSLHTLPLSSFAASCLLEPPRPSSQRIPIPWGRLPRHGPCAAVQRATDLSKCLTTKLSLGNGNKLIFTTSSEQSWNYERLFRVSSTVAEHTLEFGYTSGSQVYSQKVL